MSEDEMSKKKPEAKGPPKPMMWVYFVAYTMPSPSGPIISRREVKLDKSIRSIADIDRVEKMIQDSLNTKVVVVTGFQYLRNEPIKTETPEE